MAKRISKNPRSIQLPRKDDLTYEVVHNIAYKLLVEQKPIPLVAHELGLAISRVTNIREAKRQTDYWIEAIADLGRKGLIE